MRTWTTEKPTVPGWYWTRWKIEGDDICVYL